MAEAQESRLSIVIDTKNAEERIKELRKQLAELGQQSDETGDNTDDLGRRQRQASDDAGNLGSANDNARKSLDSMAKAAALAGAALAGAIGLSIAKAQSFETAMAEVNKTVDFTAANGLGDLKKELIDLSRVIPLPFEELAAIAAAGGQVGVADTALRGFTETIAKMAIAFDLTAAETAKSMAKIASSYKIPIESIGDLGDAINTVSNTSAAEAGELVDFMLRVGQSANNFHIAGEAAAAMGGTLIDAGGRVEVVGTAMTSVFKAMADARWVEENNDIFKQIGLNTEQYLELMKTDGLGAFHLLREAVMNSADPLALLGDLFDNAGGHVAELFQENSKLVEILDSVGQGAEKTNIHLGSMEEEYKKMAATSANAMQLTKSMIDVAVATIGEAFLPVLNELLQQISPIIDKVTVWAQANPELIRTIALVSAALLGSIVSLKLTVDGFTAMKNTIDGLKLGFAAVNNPIGLTIIALGAVLAVGVLVYQNWDKIKQVVKDNETAFALAAIAVGALSSSLIVAKAPMIFAAAQAWVMAAGATAWTGAATIAAGATWLFNAALAVLTSPITLVVAAIGLIAFMGYQVVKNWAAISAGLNAEFNKIKSYVLNTVASMQAAWDRGVANTRGAIINIKNTIVTTLKELPSRMLQIGKDIVMGLVNGIKSGASGVTTAISSMASSAVAKAKSVLDIRSPSRVMKKVGEQTAEGMAVGIKKGAKAVKSEAQKMAESAVKAVQDGVANLKREIALFGNDSPVAALKYDISVGKFGGANTGQLMSLTQTKEQLELSKKLADANKSVQDSIDGLIKQRALFGNSSSYAALVYDIEHTEKYKGVSEGLLKTLKEQALAYEQLGMTAKATQAIQERFAKLKTDQEASGKAVDGVMGELQAETAIGKIQADYERRIEVIRKHEELTTGLIGSEEDKRIAIYESAQKAKELIQIQGNEKLFGELSSITSKFFGEQSAAHMAMFAVEKYFALKRILVENKVALAKAWASAAFPYNLPAVATVAAQTGLLSAAVKGFKQGGYTGNMGASQVAGVVHGQEYVFDAQSTKRIGVDNLNAMRRGDSPKGGGDVNINVNVDAKGNAQVSGDNERMGRDMANGIKAVVLDVIRKEKRQGGML